MSFRTNDNKDWHSPFLALLAYCNLDNHALDRDSNGKYGFENDTFIIRPYDWSDEDEEESGRESLPNFEYKPTGFSISWYKYALRGAEMKPEISWQEYLYIIKDCIDTIQVSRKDEQENH